MDTFQTLNVTYICENEVQKKFVPFLVTTSHFHQIFKCFCFRNSPHLYGRKFSQNKTFAEGFLCVITLTMSIIPLLPLLLHIRLISFCVSYSEYKCFIYTIVIVRKWCGQWKQYMKFSTKISILSSLRKQEIDRLHGIGTERNGTERTIDYRKSHYHHKYCQ